MPARQRADQSPSCEPVIVGRFGAAFGIKGWIKVRSFTAPPDKLPTYKPWLLKKEGHWQPLIFSQCKPHKDSFIVQIEHISDRDAAAALTGQQIAVAREALPPLPDGEYYLRDLLGLAVKTTTGDLLGVVKDIMESKTHDVLVVRTDAGKEHLIPWLPDQGVVQAVSLSEKQIIVDWDIDY